MRVLEGRSHLADALEASEKAWRDMQPTPRSVLFHYTDSMGLRGILEHSVLWATHVRYLNDSGELAYGYRVVEQFIAARAEASDSPHVRKMLDLCMRLIGFSTEFDHYVACLCEDSDSLNQWRAYTGKGGGYALGIGGFKIDQDVFNGVRWQKRNFAVRKVIYGLEEQRQLLARFFDPVIGTLNEFAAANPSDVDSFIQECAGLVSEQVQQLLICFKHDCFRSEQEWRLCHFRSSLDVDGLRFRDGAYGLTPYVALDVRGTPPFVDRVPLFELVCGPSPNPSNTRHAAILLLQAYGQKFATVSSSELPMRMV